VYWGRPSIHPGEPEFSRDHEPTLATSGRGRRTSVSLLGRLWFAQRTHSRACTRHSLDSTSMGFNLSATRSVGTHRSGFLFAWTPALAASVFGRAANSLWLADAARLSAALHWRLYRPSSFTEKIDSLHQFDSFHFILSISVCEAPTSAQRKTCWSFKGSYHHGMVGAVSKKAPRWQGAGPNSLGLVRLRGSLRLADCTPVLKSLPRRHSD